MESRDPDLCKATYEVNTTTAWTLQKIREAYFENLELFNDRSLFLIRETNRKETELDTPDPDGLSPFESNLLEKLKEVGPKLRAAADQSGNAQTWQIGQSLDGLSQGIKERVEKALLLGI